MKNLWTLLLACLFFACNTNSNQQEIQKAYQSGYNDGFKAASGSETTTSPQNNYPTPQENNNVSEEAPSENSTSACANGQIPQKVITTLSYIRQHHEAPDGYVGGRHFGNYENLLPKRDAGGNAIEYQEWDVKPKVEGKNRGVERLVTGSDGRAWFTNNHYKSFTEVK